MSDYKVCSFYVCERLADALNKGRKDWTKAPTVDDYWLLNVLVEGVLHELQREIGVDRIKEGRHD